MHEVIGWIGALLYIIAYFLISIKKLQAGQVIFQCFFHCKGAKNAEFRKGSNSSRNFAPLRLRAKCLLKQ
jgi:hypothetical protein